MGIQAVDVEPSLGQGWPRGARKEAEPSCWLLGSAQHRRELAGDYWMVPPRCNGCLCWLLPAVQRRVLPMEPPGADWRRWPDGEHADHQLRGHLCGRWTCGPVGRAPDRRQAPDPWRHWLP